MRISVIVACVLAATEALAGQTSAQMKVGVTITGAAVPAPKNHRATAPANNATQVAPTRSVSRRGNTRIILTYY